MPQPTKVSCPADAALAFKPRWPRGKLRVQECFLALYLDSQNQVLGKPTVVAIGTAGSVCVHPRDVFREAVRRNACGVIVAHNHPSGSLSASVDDLNLVARLRTAGELLGIAVLDSLIVGPDGSYAAMLP